MDVYIKRLNWDESVYNALFLFTESWQSRMTNVRAIHSCVSWSVRLIPSFLCVLAFMRCKQAFLISIPTRTPLFTFAIWIKRNFRWWKNALANGSGHLLAIRSAYVRAGIVCWLALWLPKNSTNGTHTHTRTHNISCAKCNSSCVFHQMRGMLLYSFQCGKDAFYRGFGVIDKPFERRWSLVPHLYG